MGVAKKINIRPGEKISKTVRRYGLIDWWKYLVGFILLAGASFMMFQLFAYGYLGYISYGLIILLGLLMLFRTWFFNHNNIFVITNERIVDIHRAGWFDVVVSSVSYKEIKDVAVRKKGVCSNVFNYGTVIIQGKSDKFVIEVIKISHPQEIQALVQDSAEQFLSDKKLVDTKTIYRSFIKIIPELTDDQLKAVNELILSEFEEVGENEYDEEDEEELDSEYYDEEDNEDYEDEEDNDDENDKSDDDK